MCVSNVATAQTHNQGIVSNTFFSNNYLPTQHFDGATFGHLGGNLFLGGSNGEKGMTWNAMQSTSTGYNFMSGRSAAQMDYSHWNKLWRLKFSSNTAASGTDVTWQTGLQVQLTGSGDVEMRLCGDFYTREVNISANSWCDYVFAEEYKLRSLADIEAFIKQNKHLPEVPSEKEVIKNGISVTEMLQIHMKKIEELTLYTIQQQKEIDALKETLKSN